MDIFLIFFSLVFVVLIFVLSINSHLPAQMLLLALCVSTFYYAVAGPIYWVLEKDSIFLQVDWSGQIGFSSLVLSFGTFVFSFFLKSFIRGDGFYKEAASQLSDDNSSSTLKILFWVVSSIAGFYVIFLAFVLGVSENTTDPFFLIAYQFSDSLIPLFLYNYATAKNIREKIYALVSYLAFALMVGFRYKIAMFIGPIVFYEAYSNFKSSSFSISVAVAKLAAYGSYLVLALSFLTLIRKPFAGVDVSAAGDFDTNDYLYGLFAEANTIFGLSAVIFEFVNKFDFYYFDSIRDAVLEFIPRFVYQDRVTGAYLGDVLHRIGTIEALFSGTAYPYIGEWLLMFGYFGLCFYFLLFSLFARRYVDLLLGSVASSNVKLMGLALFAVYFGYYFYSRGYFAQSFKGFIFSVLPYLLLAVSSRQVITRGIRV